MVNIKRKVIQIANSTQLVSLPRKWSQKYGIKKGDELDVEENGESLVIRTDKDISSNRGIEIDFKGKGQDMIHRTLSSLYRSGYDEIRISFERPSEFEVIQSTINQELIGFEIVEQGREHIIVKQVTNINHSEFDAILRRTFIFLISTSEECIEALKSNNVNVMKNLIFRDLTINKLTDYCRRSLNKKEGHFKHIGPGYTIIEFLEKIGDGYRDLCKYVSQNKIKINKLILELLYEINGLLKDAYKLFYNFNLNDMEKFLMKKDTIEADTLKLSKNVNKNEILVLIYLNEITNNVFYLNGPMVVNAI